MNMLVDNSVFLESPRARARFQNLETKKKVKQFRVAMRGYKRPDFNRMILDLLNLGWTHEKIAFVLPVAGASTVSEWARGGVPNFENGDAFILLWQTETGLQRFPREDEWLTYKYTVGQQDLLGVLDDFAAQLDNELGKRDGVKG
ncbi:hypothetical protein [Acinetobacter sp. NIPH 817]|uniref:hypothetical protein n=1 Tax=Acinetobacter TaxID=469 RepID=UPI00054D539E